MKVYAVEIFRTKSTINQSWYLKEYVIIKARNYVSAENKAWRLFKHMNNPYQRIGNVIPAEKMKDEIWTCDCTDLK